MGSCSQSIFPRCKIKEYNYSETKFGSLWFKMVNSESKKLGRNGDKFPSFPLRTKNRPNYEIRPSTQFFPIRNTLIRLSNKSLKLSLRFTLRD